MNNLSEVVKEQAARIERLEADSQRLHQLLLIAWGRLNVLTRRTAEASAGGLRGDALDLESAVLEREMMKEYERLLSQMGDKGLQAWLDEWRPVDLGEG